MNLNIPVFTEKDYAPTLFIKESEIHVWLINWPEITSWLDCKWNVMNDQECWEVRRFKQEADMYRSSCGRIFHVYCYLHIYRDL